MSSSPALGSVLTVWRLLGVLSPSLCPSPTCAHVLSLSLSQSKYINKLKKIKKEKQLYGVSQSLKYLLSGPLQKRAAWVAQAVECLTSAQVMISGLLGSSPTLGSVLTVWRLLGILSLCPSSLKINKPKKKKKKKGGLKDRKLCARSYMSH